MSNPAPTDGSRTPPQAAPGSSRRLEAWLLLLALVLGAVRFLGLGDPSLWFDEALTISDAWNPRGGNYNTPGYALNRWLTERVGGPTDEFALRLPAALWGWLAVPLTWWTFRPLGSGARAAGAALLVAVSPWALHWSQTARPYTIVSVVCLAGAGLHFRGLVGGRAWLALAGIGFVGLGFKLQAQALVLAGAMVGGGALLLPLGVQLEPRQKRALRATLIVGAGAGVLAVLLAEDVWTAYLRQKQEIVGLGAVMHFIKTLGYQVTPWLGLAALAGTWVCFRSRDGASMHVAGTVVLGCLGVAGAAWFAQTTGQYVFVTLPWFAYLAAWPLARRGSGQPGWSERVGARAAWMALLVAPSIAGCWYEVGPHRGGRPRWREAWGVVDSQRGPRDLVVAHQAGLGELYLVPGWTDAQYPMRVGWADRTNPQTLGTIELTPRRVWVVVQPSLFEKWAPPLRRRLERFLAEDCRLVARFETHAIGRDLTLEVYERPGAP